MALSIQTDEEWAAVQRLLHDMRTGKRQEPFAAPTSSAQAPDGWLCDCADSVIRKVDSSRPHIAIKRDGWFCMGCLREFVPNT